MVPSIVVASCPTQISTSFHGNEYGVWNAVDVVENIIGWSCVDITLVQLGVVQELGCTGSKVWHDFFPHNAQMAFKIEQR